MKRKIVLVAAALILSSLFILGFESADDVIAFRAIEQGDYKGALEIYLKKNNYSGAGIAYLGMRRYDIAKESFEKANDLSGMGMAYCGKRQYDEAIKHFEQKKDYSGIGLAYCGKRDFNKAREYFRQANDYSGMGLAALGENKIDEARGWFSQAGDKGGLGLVLLAERRYDEALTQFASNKDNSGIGHAYCGKRDFDRALKYFKQANDLSGISLAYSGKKQFDEAIKYALTANDLSALGHAYCGKRQYDKAISSFSQANDKSGLSVAYNGMNSYSAALSYAKQANDPSALGYAYLKGHNYKGALDSFTKANDPSGIGFTYCVQKDYARAAQYAKNANDLSLLGHVYLGAGDFKEAENCFTAANDLSGLGLTQLKDKKFDKALELFQKANDLSGLGFLYGEIGDYVKSEKYFTDANDMSGLGRMALKRKQFNQAIKYFNTANDLDALGDIYWQLRSFDKAIEYFKSQGDDIKIVQALREKKKRDPMTGKVIYYGADEAIAYAQSKIDEGKFVAPLHIEVGHIYFERKDYEKALKEYETALSSDTYYAAEALFWIGKVRYYQRNYPLAKEAFERLVSNYPYHFLTAEAKGVLKLIERLGKQSAAILNNACGPYALNLLLNNYGIKSTPEGIAKFAGTDIEGTTLFGLIKAAKNSGLELSAFKIDAEDLKEYKGKAILFVDSGHYVFLKSLRSAGILVRDNLSDEFISYKDLPARWKGQILAVKVRPDVKELAADELLAIKGGNRRSSEGGITKNDPGVLPNGKWEVEYGKLEASLPEDYLVGVNLYDSMTGHNPHADGGLGMTYMGSGQRASTQCDTPVDPIAITGGQVIIPKTDIFIPGRGRKHGISLNLTRTYSSSSEVDSKIGFGWALAHDVKMQVIPAQGQDPEKVIITGPDGTIFSYEYNGAGSYYGPECDGSELINNGDGTYDWIRWTIKYGKQRYHFDNYQGTRRVLYIEDLNGNRLSYIYGGPILYMIYENWDRHIDFTYSNGRISTVTGVAGSLSVTYNYYYDNGNLISVTGPENYSETYEYNDASNIHNVTAYIDSEGNRTEYHYISDPSNISDVCDRVTDAKGNQATYEYLFETGVTAITDMRNRTSTFEYVKGKITRITDSNNGVTNYTFDDSYIRDSVTDENGKGCGWVQDRFGSALQLDNDEGYTAYFTYDPAFHYITSITDPKERAWTYDYDSNGNLRHRYTPSPNNQGTATIEKQYDQYGCLTKIIDPEGIATDYTYDTYGNITKETDGEGNYIQYTYDTLGRMASSKYGDNSGSDPVATSYEYDGLGRLTRKTYPDSSYEEYTYDKNSNLLTFRDANNHTTTYVYNELNQCVSITDPGTKVTQYEYDAFGNMTKLIRYVNGNPVETTYEYNDHYNRLTKITDPTGEITIFTYESSPPLLNDSKNYTTMKKYRPDSTLLAVESRTFDSYYRIKTVADGLGNTTTYNYDEVGNLTSVVDQNGHTTTYTYDPNVNVVLTETDPLNKTTTCTYYKNGKLKTKTDANGNTITYTYDLAGKLYSVSYPDSNSVVYLYNRYGKTAAMTDYYGTTTYAYNSRTWLSSVDGPEAYDTITYSYDYVGNRISMTTPAGYFSYAYYANNLPYTLTNSQSQTTTFYYDTANRLTRMNYPNSTYTEWLYYDNDRVNTLTVKDGSQNTLSSYHYDYNSLGKITTISNNSGNTYNFIYNDAGRLTHEDKTGSYPYTRNYTYDNAGNRTSETRDGLPISNSYNAANQITSRILPYESTGYTYDNNGNLVVETNSRTGTTYYYYDYENRPWGIITPYINTYYAYSGDGRRITTNIGGNVVKYLYDGLAPLIERDASNNILVMYTKLPSAPGGIGGLVSSFDWTNTLYYHDSNLGNVNQITNSSGAVIQTYDYDAFGNIIYQSGSLASKHTYKTKEYTPQTGLVYFGRRYYNPLIGRFITKDPSGMVDGPNLYSYCWNDPVNKMDLWGMRTIADQVGQVLKGIAQMAGGAALVVSSAGGEVVSGGMSTPVSVAGVYIGAGTASIGFANFLEGILNSGDQGMPNSSTMPGMVTELATGSQTAGNIIDLAMPSPKMGNEVIDLTNKALDVKSMYDAINNDLTKNTTNVKNKLCN